MEAVISEKMVNNIAVCPEKWVEEHGDYLLRFAMVRVNNKQIAEDLVQDTFFSAIKKVDTFEGKSSVRTWLTAIIRRKIIDYYRKKSTHMEEQLPESPFNVEGEMIGHWRSEFAPQEWQGNPEDAFNQKEFFLILRDCLSHLPDKIRAVFVMKELDQLDSEYICKEMNITSSNYWVLLHRARLGLRQCLEKNWFQSE
ncbi:MAG: RNA polymerase factor sigma-70 [Calditrichia bacterium]